MCDIDLLTIVRRKFPQLRTAVMTSVVDAQFRARAYAMGIDLFLEKPNTGQEINWDQAMNSQERLVPANLDWNMKLAAPPLAMPGITKFV